MNTNWKEEEADMKYSIGEIANLLGISIVAVRNYEKCGLIEPQRNEQNNYREYNAIDLNLIRRARTYMSYGFSLSESTYMLKGDDLSGVARALREKEADIEQRMLNEYRLLTFARHHAAYLERISMSMGECSIEMSPAFYGVVYRERTQIFADESLNEKVRIWNDIRPFAETLLVFKKEAFIREENRYQSGLCIEERFAPYFDIMEDKHVSYYPTRRAVHMVASHVFEPEQGMGDFGYGFVLDWIRQRELTISGDPFGRVLHTSKSSGKWMHHVEFWIPIE